MRVQLPPVPRELVRPPDLRGATALRGPSPPSPGASPAGAGSVFERTCTDLLASERAVQMVIARLRSGRSLSPAQLLQAQMAVYQNLQRVEFLAKCLQSAQSALNTLRQG
jgi:hypothetical protein